MIKKYQSITKGSLKNSFFLNGRAIKALPLPPPPLKLDTRRNFLSQEKVMFSLMAGALPPPPS